MLVAIIPIIALIIGILLWRPTLPEVGKVLFVCGAAVAMLVAAKYSVHLP
jgi:hypothetical protein